MGRDWLLHIHFKSIIPLYLKNITAIFIETAFKGLHWILGQDYNFDNINSSNSWTENTFTFSHVFFHLVVIYSFYMCLSPLLLTWFLSTWFSEVQFVKAFLKRFSTLCFVYLFMLFLRPHPGALRGYSRLYTHIYYSLQFQKTRGIPGIEHKSAMCKANTLPTVLLLWPLFYFVIWM